MIVILSQTNLDIIQEEVQFKVLPITKWFSKLNALIMANPTNTSAVTVEKEMVATVFCAVNAQNLTIIQVTN